MLGASSLFNTVDQKFSKNCNREKKLGTQGENSNKGFIQKLIIIIY